jgi:hypothetical protein
MYFEHAKSILLHVPKTAGNMIQSKLAPYSSDRMVLSGHGGHLDGFDRFEIMGDVTPHKHATLQEYYDVLGDKLYDHKVFVTVRHPVDRAVSLYFSPGKNMRLKTRARFCRRVARALEVDVIFGQKEWQYSEPEFTLEKFQSLVKKTPSICDYLTVNGAMFEPELMIRQENLRTDIERLCSLLEIPNIPIGDRRNVSKASGDSVQQVRKDPGVWEACVRAFADDFELLGIDTSRK